MNKLSFVTLLVVGAVAIGQSASFYDSTISISLGTATSTESVTMNSIAREFSGFTLAPGEAHSVAWTFKFHEEAPRNFTGVQFKIDGSLSATASGAVAGEIIGTEEIFDISLPTSVNVGSGLISYSVPGGSSTFSKVTDIPFTAPVNDGFVSKDILIVNTSNVSLTIKSIEQTFAPVPEPASLTALALGALALIRKRRA